MWNRTLLALAFALLALFAFAHGARAQGETLGLPEEDIITVDMPELESLVAASSARNPDLDYAIRNPVMPASHADPSKWIDLYGKGEIKSDREIEAKKKTINLAEKIVEEAGKIIGKIVQELTKPIKQFLYSMSSTKIFLPEETFRGTVELVNDSVAGQRNPFLPRVMAMSARHSIQFGLPVSAQTFPAWLGQAPEQLSRLGVEAATAIMVLTLFMLAAQALIAQATTSGAHMGAVVSNLLRWAFILVFAVNGLFIFYTVNALFNAIADRLCPGYGCINYNSVFDFIFSASEDLTTRIVRTGLAFIFSISIDLSFFARVVMLNLLAFLTPIAIACMTLPNGEQAIQSYMASYSRLLLAFLGTVLLSKVFSDHVGTLSSIDSSLLKAGVLIVFGVLLVAINIGAIVISAVQTAFFVARTGMGIAEMVRQTANAVGGAPAALGNTLNAMYQQRLRASSYWAPNARRPVRSQIGDIAVPEYGYFINRVRKRS